MDESIAKKVLVAVIAILDHDDLLFVADELEWTYGEDDERLGYFSELVSASTIG